MSNEKIRENTRELNRVLLTMIEYLGEYGQELIGEDTFQSPWRSDTLFHAMGGIRSVVVDAVWEKEYRERQETEYAKASAVVIDEVSFASYAIGEEVESENKVFKSPTGLSITVADRKITEVAL